MQNREIEVKFLEVDKPQLIKQLLDLGAVDKGEEKITEQIYKDKEGKWTDQEKFARFRQTKGKTVFTYKHVLERTATGTVEIEFNIDQPEKLKAFLEELDLALARENEKIRHKFMLGDVTIDIDTWPKVPTYVEIEGPSEQSIMDAAAKLGFDYAKAEFGTAQQVIEEKYGIPVRRLRYFTFDRVE